MPRSSVVALVEPVLIGVGIAVVTFLVKLGLEAYIEREVMRVLKQYENDEGE